MTPRIFQVFFNGSMFHMVHDPDSQYFPFFVLHVEGLRLVDMIDPPVSGRPLTERQQTQLDALEQVFHRHVRAVWADVEQGDDDAG